MNDGAKHDSGHNDEHEPGEQGIASSEPLPERGLARVDLRRMLELTLIRVRGDESAEAATAQARRQLAEIVAKQLEETPDPAQRSVHG